MKATELRIGNLVNSPNNNQNPFRIDSFEYLAVGMGKAGMILDKRLHPLTWYLQDLQPIPLTEEWLLKLQFEIFGDILFLGDEYNIWKQTPNCRFNLFTIDKERWICSILNQELTEIKYIHQLQNLYFALTGEELVIKEL
jgi:hypothetical protein